MTRDRVGRLPRTVPFHRGLFKEKVMLFGLALGFFVGLILPRPAWAVRTYIWLKSQFGVNKDGS